MFGTATPDSALQAARSSKQPLEAQTEALFYLGEKNAVEGDAGKAREQWRKVLDLGVVEYVEYGAAKVKLAAAP
jgi:lipoprotein NlpI